jgi:hypothetical protein
MATEIVNGYPCKNCTDVEYAKKNVDPAHPKDGPTGADKAQQQSAATDRGPAVTFGGSVQAPQAAPPANGVETVPQSKYVPGSSITLKA